MKGRKDMGIRNLSSFQKENNEIIKEYLYKIIYFNDKQVSMYLSIYNKDIS